MGIECRRILSATRDTWKRDLKGEKIQINFGCFSRDHGFDYLSRDNFMVMVSEQRKVFVEILKRNMPKIHNENFQTWFVCQ